MVFVFLGFQPDLLAYVLTSKSSSALENELEDFVDLRKVSSLIGSSSRLPCTLGYTTLEFQWAMKRSTLFRIGLFRKERYSLELQDWLEKYLWGFSAKALTQHFFTAYRGGAIPLKDHFLQREEKDLLLHLLRKNGVGANLLFYGEPGTGKTELEQQGMAEHISGSEPP